MEQNDQTNIKTNNFHKSTEFILPNPEENPIPTFTTQNYQKLIIPETKEEYLNLYLDIVSEINNKTKEINYANALYESTGMISITDSNFIKSLLYIENKTNQNIDDIMRYKIDLLTLNSSYLNKFHQSLNKDLGNYKLLSLEYSSNLDYFLVFSNQLISVSAHEVLENLEKKDLSLNNKTKDLITLIESVKRTISRRVAFEIEYHNLDLSTIEEFINQNKELLEKVRNRLI